MLGKKEFKLNLKYHHTELNIQTQKEKKKK